MTDTDHHNPEDIDTALKLWKFLKSKGGVSEKHEEYDASLIEDIQVRLGFAVDDSLDDQLNQYTISVERFVAAVFEAVQPYTMMMTDLLQMFEEAGARATDENLSVRFDFESDDVPEVEFDLEHFREWRAAWEELTQSVPIREWNSDGLWGLLDVLRNNQFRNNQLRSDDVQSWVSTYESGTWPDDFPTIDPTGYPELDRHLKKVWSLWRDIVVASKQYGPERNDLRQAQESNGVNDSYERWPLQLLYHLDLDWWTRNTIVAIDDIENKILENQTEEPPEGNEIVEKLQEVFDSVPVRNEDMERAVRALEDLLKLPIWEKRYELYAAWITTVIKEALQDKRPRIHTYEDEILFSFSGSHLATFEALTPHLHLFTELRSPLENPVGKGREKAIQPDYRLLPDPTTRTEGTVAAVEVKQYLTPASRKFGNALTDYAKGCPNAQVILVNHGRLADTTLDYVDASVQDRATAIEYVRPDRPQKVSKFKNKIKNTVQKKYGPQEGTKEEKGSKFGDADILRVTLTWNRKPRDLDLHLFIYEGNNLDHVYWKQTGNLDSKPYVELDKDVRDGEGPETLEFARPPTGKCQFSVKRYSDDESLADSGAQLEVEFAERNLTFLCPESGEGDWWNVFSWDPETGQMVVNNHVSDSSPNFHSQPGV